MKKTLFLTGCLMTLFFLSVSSCLAQGDSLAYKHYKSLLWKVTGNDLSEPSFVYGTMHVSQKLAFHLGDSFYESLKSCDIVALELNPDTWVEEVLGEDKKLPKDRYPTVFTRNLYNSAFNIGVPDKNRIAGEIAFDGKLLNSFLYRSNGNMEDFQEDTYLDLYIFQTGKKFGLEVCALEDFNEVDSLVRKAMEPHKDDKRRSNYGENLFSKLEDAYRTGDLNALDSLNKLITPGINYQKYMLDIRNEGMVNNMDSLLREGKQVFTAVGAAHLPGEMGVIELLRAKGYTLEPMEREIAGKSKKFEKEIDNKRVPVTLSEYTTPDGFLSANLPGAFYKMSENDLVSTFVFPDMANGVYYWMKRIQTNNILIKPAEISAEEYMMKRLDSLLFEYIPGDIIEQKDISTHGFPGYDILNKTSKGDFQRYQFIATPMELLIIKMGGPKSYVKELGDQFFGSIQLNMPKLDEWSVVSPMDRSFKVKLPKYSRSHDLGGDYYSVVSGKQFVACDEENNVYFVRKVLLNDFNYLEEDNFELEYIAEQIQKDLKFDSLDFKFTKTQGYSSADFRAIKPGSTVYFEGKLIIQGANYYLLGVLSSEKDDFSEFFSSFEINPVVYQSDFKEYIDTTLHFKVNTIRVLDKKSKLQRSYYNDSYRDKRKDEGYNGKDLTSYLISHETGEAVSVFYERKGAFYYEEEIDSLWFSIKDYYFEDLVISEEVKTANDSIYTWSFIISDSLSSPLVKAKYILKNQHLYLLTSNVDPLQGPSEFVIQAFDTFEPINDTLSRFSIFENKNELFYDFVLSGDSAKVEYAIDEMYDINFSDFERYRNLIDNHYFEHDHLIKKRTLIEDLYQFDNKATLDYIEQLYLNNKDTVSYQIACLQALSYMENKDSYRLLLDLMLEDTPIPKSDNELNQIFYGLYYNTDFSSQFFPDLLKLNTIEEYKPRNLFVLSSVLEDDYLPNRKLRAHRKQLINEGVIEWKRLKAKEELGLTNKTRDYYDENDYYGYSQEKMPQDALKMYADVLIHWYDKEPKVQYFFSRLMESKDFENRLAAGTLLEEYGIATPDTLWTGFSEDIVNNDLLYEYLTDYDLMHKVDSSKIFSLDHRAYVTAMKSVDLKDSMYCELFHKVYIESKLDSGYYYFYKIAERNYSDDLDFKFIAIGPLYTDEVQTYIPTDKKRIPEEMTDEKLQERIDEFIRQQEVKGRRRVRGNSRYN